MPDGMTIDVDTRSLYAALDALGAAASKYVREAAQATAGRIRDEAARRVSRSASPQWGSHLADRIVVREVGDRDTRLAFLVYELDQSGRAPANLGLWLEFGTKYMSARPWLFAAARLEEGPHMRRVVDAVENAIREASR